MALISILAAILFPVFAQVREKARQRVCGSNLQQIGTAVTLYRQDYDGRFPLAVSGQTRRNSELWASSPFYMDIQRLPLLPDIIQPYCDSHEIFRCPSDNGIPASASSPGTLPTVYDALGMSYYFYGEGIALFDVPEYIISEPSKEVYLSDAGDTWHTFPGATYFDYRGNALYLDGHVKFVYARLQ